MYFVEGMEHINMFINSACIKYKNVEPVYIEHWMMTHARRGGLYCIANNREKLLKLSDIDLKIRRDLNVDHTFYGIKKSDSLNRAMMLKGYEKESISKSNKVYPLSQLGNNDILAYIRINKLSKPIAYSSNKKSQGLIFDVDVFRYLEKHYPKDLHKIYNRYPLSQRILFEDNYKE